MWKVWTIIPDLLCQLVEANAWKKEPRSNEYGTPRDILNTFLGTFEPSGLPVIMNATEYYTRNLRVDVDRSKSRLNQHCSQILDKLEHRF